MSTGAPNDLPHPTAADLLAYYGQFNGTIALIHGLTEQPVPAHIITNLAVLATGLATTSGALTREFADPGLADLARSMAAVERTVHVLAENWDGTEEEWKGARVRELVEAWEGAGPDVEMMRLGLGLVLRNGGGGHWRGLRILQKVLVVGSGVAVGMLAAFPVALALSFLCGAVTALLTSWWLWRVLVVYSACSMIWTWFWN